MDQTSKWMGGSEMGALIQARFTCAEGNADWVQTPLGSIADWSSSLKTALSILLNSPCPMLMVWGPDLILFYNDACCSLLGDKHPQALGQPARDCWSEVWPEMRLDFEHVMATGQRLRRETGTWFVSSRHPFTVSYSGVIDERGLVGGVLTTLSDAALATETTERQQTEMALQANQIRLKLALEATGTIYWERDLSTDQLILSSNFTDPKTSQVVLYQDALALVHPEDRDKVHQVNQTAIAERGSFELEHRLKEAPDQEWRWVLARGKALTDAAGNPTRIVGVSIDISDRKRVETERQQIQEVLRTSEERFRRSETVLRAFIASSPIGMAFLDENLRYIYVNQALAAINGVPLSEHIDRTVWDILPEWAPQIEAVVQQIIQTKEPLLNQEINGVTHPADVYRYCLVNQFPVCLPSGEVIGVGVTSMDITEPKRVEAERKQAEEALHLSEDRYRTLANAVPQLMWINSADGTVEFLNQRWLEYTGISAEISLQIWAQIIHPDDRQVVVKTRTDAIQTGEPYEIECRLKRFDQAYHWHLVRVLPLKDENGQVLQWFGTATDIDDVKQTEGALRESESLARARADALRQSERRYRYLVESIPQLVWTANAEGLLLDVNQRWSDFTGLSLAQAQIEGWPAVVHPEDVSVLSQQWAIAQQNCTYYQAEGRMRRADGVYRWYLHQAVPLKNEQGQIIKWFGTATDIEDQKQLEQQRDRILEQEQAAREAAEVANRIKDEFLAVLSHELRSPLNPILGWAKLLQTRKFDESATKRALETIERNAKLQTQLIDDLLDVSRILRGKLVLNVYPVDLVTVIEAALETVRLSVEAKGIEIHKHLTSDIGLIAGDAGRLQQVVWNLLSNAVKFTPPGGRVEVRLERVEGIEKPGLPAVPDSLTPIPSYAQIQVKDTGKGIASEFLPYVFEYFRQEDSTTTRQFGGLGLGLAIVRYLAELHGGTVWAESSGEDQGATFMVRLPLLQEQHPGMNREGCFPLSTNASPLADMRVLAVDDEADLRELLLVLLEQAGAVVKVAASAAEALAVLAAFKPDILISDIGMPQMNGYALIDQVRRLLPEQGGQIPAIALTAYAGEVDQKQALAAGFQMHISKPVEPDVLVQAIVTLSAVADSPDSV